MLRSVGLCNYYRCYIKNYADHAHELYGLAKKNSKRIIWTDKYINCFTKLKDALSCDFKLYHVNRNLHYDLQTDAFAFAIGVVLRQRETPRWSCFANTMCQKKANNVNSATAQLRGKRMQWFGL